MIRVTYQGGPGAFSEEAVYAYFTNKFPDKPQPIPCETFDDALNRLAQGQVQYAFIPIRNTIHGEFVDHQDLIKKYLVKVSEEYKFKVSMCLIAHPNTQFSNIRKVYSHAKDVIACGRKFTDEGKGSLSWDDADEISVRVTQVSPSQYKPKKTALALSLQHVRGAIVDDYFTNRIPREALITAFVSDLL